MYLLLMHGKPELVVDNKHVVIGSGDANKIDAR